MKTEKIKLSKIKLNPNNPRLIKDDKFEKLVQSIKEFPEMLELRPVVCNSDMIILGGNMRFKAAKKAGLKEVPVIIADSLDEAKQRQFAIKDNVSGGEWDWAMLADEWEEQELSDWGLDLPEDWGAVEVLPDEEPSEAAMTPPDEPVSKPGDLWLLGDHRVLCGDSTNITDVERLMNGKKANMVFTDPPYGVNYSGGIQYTSDGVVKNSREKLANDDSDDIYNLCVPIMASFCDGPIYTWFAGTRPLSLYQQVLNAGEIHALIIWVKNGGYGALNANYKQKHEPCLYWKSRNSKLNFIGKSTETTIWEIEKDGVNKYHPTQKPVSLAERAIKNHNAKTVLDLFLGSGSTLIACEKTNRICYGMELEPRYVDVIIKRWQEYTGKEAVLESTGQTFEEVSEIGSLSAA